MLFVSNIKIVKALHIKSTETIPVKNIINSGRVDTYLRVLTQKFDIIHKLLLYGYQFKEV